MEYCEDTIDAKSTCWCILVGSNTEGYTTR